jgi:TolA-binding protein
VATDKYRKVIETASKLLEFYPHSRWVDDALLLMGISYYRLTDYGRAERKFTELVTLYPDSKLVPDARLWKARTLLEQKKSDAAIDELVRATAVSSKSQRQKAEADFLLGSIYFEQKRWADAVEAFEKAGRGLQREDYTDARFMLGICRFELEQYEQACPAFHEVSRTSRDLSQAYQAILYLSRCEAALDHYDRAETLLNQLTGNAQFATFAADVDLELADIAVKSGRVDEGIAIYEEYIAEHTSGEGRGLAFFRLAMIDRDIRTDLSAAKAHLDSCVASGAKRELADSARGISTQLSRGLLTVERIASLKDSISMLLIEIETAVDTATVADSSFGESNLGIESDSLTPPIVQELPFESASLDSAKEMPPQQPFQKDTSSAREDPRRTDPSKSLDSLRIARDARHAPRPDSLLAALFHGDSLTRDSVKAIDALMSNPSVKKMQPDSSLARPLRQESPHHAVDSVIALPSMGDTLSVQKPSRVKREESESVKETRHAERIDQKFEPIPPPPEGADPFEYAAQHFPKTDRFPSIHDAVKGRETAHEIGNQDEFEDAQIPINRAYGKRGPTLVRVTRQGVQGRSRPVKTETSESVTSKEIAQPVKADSGRTHEEKPISQPEQLVQSDTTRAASKPAGLTEGKRPTEPKQPAEPIQLSPRQLREKRLAKLRGDLQESYFGLAEFYEFSLALRDSSMSYYQMAAGDNSNSNVYWKAHLILARSGKTTNEALDSTAIEHYRAVVSTEGVPFVVANEARQALDMPLLQIPVSEQKEALRTAEEAYLYGSVTPEEALRGYSEVIAIDSTTNEAKIALFAQTNIYEYDMKNPDSAIAVTQRLVNLFPDSAFTTVLRKKLEPPDSSSIFLLSDAELMPQAADTTSVVEAQADSSGWPPPEESLRGRRYR